MNYSDDINDEPGNGSSPRFVTYRSSIQDKLVGRPANEEAQTAFSERSLFAAQQGADATVMLIGHKPPGLDGDGRARQCIRDPAIIEALQTACSCWFRMDQKSRVFLDRQGGWIAADEAGTDMLLNNITGLSAAKGKLIASGAAASEMERLLAADHQPVTVILPKKNNDGHAILQATAFDEDIVCVLAVGSDCEPNVEIKSLEKAFGLTPAEADIVHHIVQGFSAAEVAHARELSINTVRAHLRHCYEKIGVSSREQLWRRIYPYCVSWADNTMI